MLARPDRLELTEALVMRVVTRAIPAGDTVNENDLATEMGVSRTPIREILNTLAGRDLLCHERKTGYRTLVFGLREIKDFFSAALHIYPHVFELSAEYRRSRDMDLIRDCLERIERSSERRHLLERVAAYRAFTLACVRACQNRNFTRMMERLIDQHIMIRMDFIRSIPVEEHEAEIRRNLAIYRSMAAAIEARASADLALQSRERLEVSRNFIISQIQAELH